MEDLQGKNARRRRALNMVWTAAGDYGFQPEFMAFYRDGAPDIYLNSVVGFVHRHYDSEKLSFYLHSFDDSLLRDIFTDLFWMGLEQAVFERESPSRPVLMELREEHARRWLEDDIDLSMQQLMMRNEIVHSMKAARCHEILGEPTGLRNPWDKRLYEALRFSGGMGTEEIIEAMQGLWKRFFLFHFTNLQRKEFHVLLGSRWTAFLRKWLPMQRESVDHSSLLANPLWAEEQGAGHGGMEEQIGGGSRPVKEEELRRLFGASLFSRAKVNRIEEEVCRDGHEGIRLWFGAGGGTAQPQNLAWYAAHRAEYRTGIARLREHLRNCLAVYRQPMELSARHGFLRPGAVWRAVRMKDTRVFSSWEETAYGDVSLLLLLDASSSREAQQPLIAGHAYAIAEGVRQAGIPIAVASFCSLWGYTVLRLMKGFGGKEANGIFRYAAQGWNRDGLALRAVPELMEEAPGRKMVLVLTDAYPSDEADIPAHGTHLSKRYLQEPAVEDTAKAVRELRGRGIRVIGLVNSVFSAGIVDDYAQRIYGRDHIRISSIPQIADVVGEVLEREIRAASS